MTIDIDSVNSSANIVFHYSVLPLNPGGIFETSDDDSDSLFVESGNVTVPVKGSIMIYAPCTYADCDVKMDMRLSLDDFSIDTTSPVVNVMHSDAVASMDAAQGALVQLRSTGDGFTSSGTIPEHALRISGRSHATGSGFVQQRADLEVTNADPISFTIDWRSSTIGMNFTVTKVGLGHVEFSVLGHIVNQPPLALAASAITAECTRPVGSIVGLDGTKSIDPDKNLVWVNWTGPGVTEVLSSVPARSKLVSSALAPMGLSEYTLSLMDAAGAMSQAHTSVVVTDTVGPSIEIQNKPACVSSSDDSAVLFKVGHGLPEIYVTDQCSDSPTWSIFNIERLGGGEAHFYPRMLSESHSFCLQPPADRSRDLRYKVTIRASDGSSNTSLSSFIITVPAIGHECGADATIGLPLDATLSESDLEELCGGSMP